MPNALLTAGDAQGLIHRGFIEINNEEYYIEVQQTTAATLTGAKLYGSPKLQRLLQLHNDTILQRLNNASNIRMFINDLTNLLERSLKAQAVDTSAQKAGTTQSMSITNYNLLLSQLNSIGLENVQYMDPKLKSFDISICDSSGRQHSIHIDLPEGNRIYPLDVTAELPCSTPAFSAKTDIPTAISSIRCLLNEHHMLFDQLDQLDSHSWVLDPIQPTRRHTHRRLALGQHCSLHLEIKDTVNPCNAPDLQLYGAESRIAKWRDALSRNMASWDPSKALLENVLKVLELPTLPQKDAAFDASADVECGICYAYHLAHSDHTTPAQTTSKDQIPSQICNNDTCGRAFHHRCLYEWLRSVPTTRQSFNVLFGFCPYCNEDITTKVIL